MVSISDLSLLGILLTFISTVFFGKGVVQSRLIDVVKANQSLMGENFDKIRAVIASTVDGRFAFIFLLIGFPLQCFSLFYDIQFSKANHLLDFALAGLILITSFLLNIYYVRKSADRIIKAIYGERIIHGIKYSMDPDTKYTEEVITNQLDNYYGKAISVKKRKEESNEDFSKRLIQLLEK